MNDLPKLTYLDLVGRFVRQPSDATYTVLNGVLCTRRDGAPEKKVNGSWVPLVPPPPT